MAVRLGTNPIAWSNDDLRDLGAATSLETCLTEARAAGYVGIELGHKFPRDAATLGPILAGHELALVSGWCSCALLQRPAADEMAAMRPHLKLLRALGSEVLILAECSNTIHGDRVAPLPGRPVLAASEWVRFGARMTELADRAADEGLAIVYHHHMGTCVQGGDDIDRLMDATGPAVRLLLDTGHATFAGVDPVALARRYRSRIGHVHCKDVRAAVMRDCAGSSFLDSVVAGVFTVPGDGSVDFAAVLAELPGYDGWLVVEAEQDPTTAHPLTYAKLGHDNLAAYARNAGLL